MCFMTWLQAKGVEGEQPAQSAQAVHAARMAQTG